MTPLVPGGAPRRPRSRNLVLALVVLLVAVPASGCLGVMGAPEVGLGKSWPLEMTQVDKLRERELTGDGVTVAVIDTGIDLDHPEFAGVTVKWADLVNGRSQPYDDNGHGTHVAGIIAAQGDWNTLMSGFYLKGVAPDVDLIIIKAIDTDGRGKEGDVATGVRTAVREGADVIVLSLGGGTLPILGTDTERAVRDAVNRGVYVVAAAGNAQKGESSCGVTSPASVQGVIAVGAVDQSERIGSFSCRGTDNDGDGLLGGGRGDPHKKPEVVAPGVAILGPWLDKKYVEAKGTSQAAPIVGGIIALVLESEPELKRKDADTVRTMKEALMVSSAKIGPLDGKGATAHDNRYGYGLVQGEALLRAVR